MLLCNSEERISIGLVIGLHLREFLKPIIDKFPSIWEILENSKINNEIDL